jgi:SPP1 gp7 family putative phage head morphogenesis protein
MSEEIQLENLTFEDALKYFRAKLPLTEKEFYALEAAARARAFTVANVATLDIVQAIYNSLLKAIETGATMEEFRQEVNEFIRDEGYTGLTPYRADNIFRTNIQTAYNVGRYAQQTLPSVTEARPIWIYDAVNDSRTRPAHLAMDGVARRYDDPFWDTWYPPNGFRCRCSVRTASEGEAERKGIAVETGDAPAERRTPDGQRVAAPWPDLGFDTNPAKSGWRPDLARYGPALKKQYEEKAARRK